MKELLYGVIILNYRTAQDALNAAQSVVECAKTSKFIVCIVDGASNDELGSEILSRCTIPNTEIVFLDTNGGYAKGNNAAIRYLCEKYSMEYIVIMNPDVTIVEKSTIEDIVSIIETDEKFVGGQPLVWTKWMTKQASEQINIRRVFDYYDCIIESFFLFKKIFKKRYQKNVYIDYMPYITPVVYEVPSGAFFVIRYDFFNEIGLFDERTFLYGEEMILGFLIKEKKKSLVLLPSHKVIHESGKSIGSNAKLVTKFAHNELKKSQSVYLVHYLGVGFLRLKFIMLLNNVNFLLKNFHYKLTSKYN